MVGTPASAGSMSMPSAAMMAGTEPREAMPIWPQAVQSMAMPRVSGRADGSVVSQLVREKLA